MKKQYVFVPKWFWLVAALVMLANLVVPVMAVSNALDSDEAEVVVEVYINNYDEEYIKNWTFDDGTKVCDYNYVITYQPVPRSYALGQYFDFAAWIPRTEGISLSLAPNSEVRASSSLKEIAWNCLASTENGFGAQANFANNEQVLKWQYDCHFTFANQKDRWNLEPWRTASSYAEVVLKGCNPD